MAYSHEELHPTVTVTDRSGVCHAISVQPEPSGLIACESPDAQSGCCRRAYVCEVVLQRDCVYYPQTATAEQSGTLSLGQI